MTTQSVRSALAAWVKALSGVEIAVWENDPRPMHNGVIALLSWGASDVVGVDDLRWQYAENESPLEEMTPAVQGDRVLRVQVAFETTLQAIAGNARELCERMRSRLRRPSSLAALAAVGLGLVSAGPAVQADYRAQQHMVARALFDVTLNATTWDADADGATSYIATVEVTSHVSDVSGDELPASLQMQEQVIP